MADEQPKIKLRFAEDNNTPALEINNGPYNRKFDAKEQPFDCDDEEAAMLLRTGYFVEQTETEVATKRQPRGKIGGAPANESESS